MIAGKYISNASALLLAAFVMLCQTGLSFAATFSVQRAISFDQWVTWPDESRWNDAEILNNFPEWQSFVSDEEIAALRGYGFDTVRMPVDPAMLLHAGEDGRTDTLFKSMLRAIERLRDANLKVIVDLHTIPYGADNSALGINHILNDDLTFVRYKAMVGRIAAALSKFDSKIIALELINEPNYDCTKGDMAALWQAQVTQLHQAARAANSDITLIIPGGCHASAEGLASINPKAFDDDNIIWTFHSYEPFIVTHQSALWVGKPVSAFQNLPYPPSALSAQSIRALPQKNGTYIDGTLSGTVRKNAGWFMRNELESWGNDADLAKRMEAPFALVAVWADKHKIARDNIFLGEFGFIAQEYGKDFKTDPTWRIAYLKDMIGFAEKYGYGWSIWSYGGAFGIAQGFGGEPMPGDLLEKLNLQTAY